MVGAILWVVLFSLNWLFHFPCEYDVIMNRRKWWQELMFVDISPSKRYDLFINRAVIFIDVFTCNHCTHPISENLGRHSACFMWIIKICQCRRKKVDLSKIIGVCQSVHAQARYIFLAMRRDNFVIKWQWNDQNMVLRHVNADYVGILFSIWCTVYPKKYAHGFCFAVLCCGYTLTDFPISIRLTSLALWQSNDCPSASKTTLMNMDKYFMWIHYERLHNHNKAKHNKTVCIFLGIYCSLMQHLR